jgi:hypothetical protein
MHYRHTLLGIARQSFRFARLLALALLVLVCLSGSSSATRTRVSRFDALPRAPELLAQPIELPQCGMRILEWRSSDAMHDETTPSPEAIAFIDETCARAAARYGEFLKSKKLQTKRSSPEFLPAISVLPGNVLLDGKSGRALNDLPNRFEAVAPGCCYWGLYVDGLNHLFVRNDPLLREGSGKLVHNMRFARTMTHEMSHVLSARLGVWDIVGYERDADEKLAEEFVGFMGFDYPTESSADDLAYHRVQAPERKAPTPTPSAAPIPPVAPASPQK